MSANGNELITLSQFKMFVNAISSEGNEFKSAGPGSYGKFNVNIDLQTETKLVIVLVISEYDRIRELMAVLALDTETENEASSDSIAWSYENRRLNVNNGSTFYFDELAFYVYYLEMSKGIDDLFTE